MKDAMQIKGRKIKLSVMIPPLTQGLAEAQKPTNTHSTQVLEVCQVNETRSRGIVSVLNAEKYPNR